MTKLKRKGSVYLLVISFDDEVFPEVNTILSTFRYTLRSKISKDRKTEMTVEITLKDENTQFTQKLTPIKGVYSVSMISYSGEFAQ